MSGFTTKNSVYTLDNERKVISGGILGRNVVPFVSAVVLIGLPAEITLANGQVIRTSTVCNYV